MNKIKESHCIYNFGRPTLRKPDDDRCDYDTDALYTFPFSLYIDIVYIYLFACVCDRKMKLNDRQKAPRRVFR